MDHGRSVVRRLARRRSQAPRLDPWTMFVNAGKKLEVFESIQIDDAAGRSPTFHSNSCQHRAGFLPGGASSSAPGEVSRAARIISGGQEMRICIMRGQQDLTSCYAATWLRQSHRLLASSPQQRRGALPIESIRRPFLLWAALFLPPRQDMRHSQPGSVTCLGACGRVGRKKYLNPSISGTCDIRLCNKWQASRGRDLWKKRGAFSEART